MGKRGSCFIAWKSSSNIMMSIRHHQLIAVSLYGIRLVDLKFRARNAVERIIYKNRLFHCCYFNHNRHRFFSYI